MGDQSLATRRVEAVLITGVYGSGKSSVAAEVAYLLEQRSEPYALLDLDYLSWAGTGSGGRAEEFGRMLANLTAVASNYRQAGIALFVLAYFVRDHAEARLVEEALGVPLTVVSLTVPLPEIERRLLADVTSGRRDDLRAAAMAISAALGAGVADLTIANDRPVGLVAGELMAFLGWSDPAGQPGSQRSGGTA
jgi:energy-coupling factor transporter ATP-binding protein EcfA2